jgi:ATP-dependent Clp protease adaptor protein ClpS
MTDIATIPRVKPRLKTAPPRLHKVILVNDDYTPREFVVTVLKGVFGMGEDEAHRVMITAHTRGACVVAVFAKDIAETKATRATDAGRSKGYPLLFTTEPEGRKADPSGEVVPLTASEFARGLSRSPQPVLAREQLLSATRVHDEEVFDRRVDVQILRSRRNLEVDASHPALIRTERSAGY